MSFILGPPLELGLPFAPANVGVGYLAWPLLPELFPTFFPGVQTKRDELLVDTDRDRLVERMKLYFDPKIGDEEMGRICPRAMETNAQFDAKLARDYLTKRGFQAQQIVSHCYRPLDERWVYWEPEAGLVARRSPEYFPQIFQGNVCFAGAQKKRRAFDPPIVTGKLASLHVLEIAAVLFPLRLRPAANRELLREFVVRSPASGEDLFNLSEAARHYLIGVDSAGSADALFYHAIATQFSTAYGSDNADALRQDWPRIPLPDSKELLLASAALGRRIAALLDTEAPFDVAPASRRQPAEEASGTPATKRQPPGWWRYIAVPTRVDGNPLNEGKDLAVTAGWGHVGKGGVTMPGKGRLMERDYLPEERDELLGDRTCDVYLNEVAYWRNIPIRVWEYTISGYQVIKKWLSYREEKLLARPLRKDEVRWVQEMAQRIAGIILLEPALDENYRAVKSKANRWRENS